MPTDKKKTCNRPGAIGTIEGSLEASTMITIKAKIGGTIEKRLELERQRTGVDTASIVRIALDQYLHSFEFYEREGYKEESKDSNDER